MMRDCLFLFVLPLLTALPIASQDTGGVHHVWEMVEIELTATGEYANPYAEVTSWAELEGPGFSKRVYGFW
ncbi:MAG: DUF5060 domain-containing protein, partial [Lewinella sp.]